jgi:hypothetical protein
LPPMQASSARRVAGSASSSSTMSRRRCHHRLRTDRLRTRLTTRLDRSKTTSLADDHSRSVPYRLDTPTSPAVARCRRRFVSTSDDAIAVDSQPGNARPMWGLAGTLPQRCRHGAIPTDPARQETPDTLGTQHVPIGFASQHGWLLTMYHGNPEGPPWRPKPHAYQR